MSIPATLLKIIFIALPLALAACGDKPEQGATSTAAVSQIAQKYEGKIVHQSPANRGKEDGWYLVKDGKRRWISDGAWLAKNGYQPSEIIQIDSAEFNSIPEDPMPLGK